MNTHLKIYVRTLIIGILSAACDGETGTPSTDHGHDHHHDHESEEAVRFSSTQFKELGMKTGFIPTKNLSAFVEANGQLEVPPQNEASVTATLGSNIASIKVIEGDKVSKGQVLAYLSHPNLIELQTEYANNWSQLQYLENEYKRQSDLNESKAVSDRDFQQVRANYFSTKAAAAGDGAQLRLLGLNLSKIRDGQIYTQVPLTSPIAGYVRFVNAKIGQYVLPETSLFEIVNIDHIHADLMVFEKDIHKVKVDQVVRFKVESLPGKELEAIIYSVGKAFENGPKAIHLHAEITNKEGLLIPGMYVKGRIMIDEQRSLALPEEALVRQDNKHFAFSAIKEAHDSHGSEWLFIPFEVKLGTTQGIWTSVIPVKPITEETSVALNNAFYLMAEMKKEETEHSH